MAKKKKKATMPKRKLAKARKHKKAAPGDPNKTYRKKVVKHKPNGQFAKGNCANPYGRPKGSFSFKNAYERSLQRLAKKGTSKTKLDELVDSLVDQAIREAFRERITFAKEAADRIDGKPAQTVHTPDLRGDPYDELSDSEVDVLLAARVVDDPDEEET